MRTAGAGAQVRPMRLGVDIREWEPGRRTGIGTFLAMFLSEAPRQRPGLTPLLYGNPATALPPGGSLSVRRLREPFRLWFDQVSLARGVRADVFLSPYYKMPLLCPCPGVITIHDLLFLEYPPTARPMLPRGGSPIRPEPEQWGVRDAGVAKSRTIFTGTPDGERRCTRRRCRNVGDTGALGCPGAVPFGRPRGLCAPPHGHLGPGLPRMGLPEDSGSWRLAGRAVSGKG